MFWLYWVFDKMRGLLLFWSMGSVPLQHVGLSYPIRDWSHIPYIAKQILNYWNTKEVPIYIFFHLLVESQFPFLKYNVKYFREGRSREAFWRLIILVFLRAVFCCIHVRTHPCREAGETSLPLSRTTLHGATLCSIHSSLLWSFPKCIISFTGFSARIQKYLKVSVSLAFRLLPFPKQKKQDKLTVSLFLYQTVELPSTEMLSTCASTGPSRLVQMLFLWPLPTWPSLYQVHPFSLTC